MFIWSETCPRFHQCGALASFHQAASQRFWLHGVNPSQRFCFNSRAKTQSRFLAEDLNVKKKRRSDRVLGRQGTPLAHSLPSILVLAVLSLATVGFAIWRIIDGRTSRANDHAIDHSVATIRFTPTVENKNPPPQEPPDGMIWIPGGEFSMGAQDPPDMNPVGMNATEDSRPVHRVYVDGFWMDQTDVTNKQFAK